MLLSLLSLLLRAAECAVDAVVRLRIVARSGRGAKSPFMQGNFGPVR
jgi:hypothetical protein